MQRHHRLTAKTAILLAAAGASLCLAAATFAAGGGTGGTVHVFITPSLTGKRRGNDRSSPARSATTERARRPTLPADPTRRALYSLSKLHYGSILLNTTPLRRAINLGIQRARPDLASCSLQGSTSASVPIVRGTGRYAGISGSIRAKFTFAEVAGRHTSGAKKGTCNLVAGPVAQWASIVGTGTVSFK